MPTNAAKFTTSDKQLRSTTFSLSRNENSGLQQRRNVWRDGSDRRRTGSFHSAVRQTVLHNLIGCVDPLGLSLRPCSDRRSHCVIRKRVIYLGRRPVIQRGSHGLIRVANLFLNRTRKRE